MNEIEYLPPQKFTYKNVCFWEPNSKQLLFLKRNGDKSASTMLTKSKKFLEFNCIQPQSKGLYKILPIKDYNKTTYSVDIEKEECNCQGYSIYGKCSHILAVKQYIFIHGSN